MTTSPTLLPRIFLIIASCALHIYDDMYADPEWISCGLTPKSEVRQAAVLWMSEYFDMCDVSPDSDFIKVNSLMKRDIYRQYCVEQDALDPDTGVVSEPTFNELWAVIYPYCVRRTYCNIPGKCEICGTIDKLRRSANTRLVHMYLKKAHLLHRGGMFMLERKRLCACMC
jgi:hypothetical protein